MTDSSPAGWILQSNPKRYDIDAALQKIDRIAWRTPKYRSKIEVGHPVFIWRSGRDAGLIARGIVESAPAVMPQQAAEAEFERGDAGPSPEFRSLVNLAPIPYVPKALVVALPEMAGNLLLKLPNQTVFPLTSQQIAALEGLLKLPPPPVPPVVDSLEASAHTQAQRHLLALGARAGLTSWVARNDRGRLYDGVPLGSMDGVIKALPVAFASDVQSIIEHIDVLWLRDNAYVAAFEIEQSTAIYSGLLRMSDLVALVPNLSVPMFIVAPESRRKQVRREALRPTFAKLEIPERCQLITTERLTTVVEGLEALNLTGLGTQVLDNLAESLADSDDG